MVILLSRQVTDSMSLHLLATNSLDAMRATGLYMLEKRFFIAKERTIIDPAYPFVKCVSQFCLDHLLLSGQLDCLVHCRHTVVSVLKWQKSSNAYIVIISLDVVY